MLRLVSHRLFAIGLSLRELRQRVLQSHLLDGLFGAKQLLFAAYVPIGQLFLWVSCPYYRHNTARLFNFSKSNKKKKKPRRVVLCLLTIFSTSSALIKKPRRVVLCLLTIFSTSSALIWSLYSTCLIHIHFFLFFSLLFGS